MSALAVQAEIYEPQMNSEGLFYDALPYDADNLSSWKCNCNNGRKTYHSNPRLKAHFKTKHHKKWLNQKNNKKNNEKQELSELRKETRTQKIVIGQLSNELSIQKNIISDFMKRLGYVSNSHLEKYKNEIQELKNKIGETKVNSWNKKTN